MSDKERKLQGRQKRERARYQAETVQEHLRKRQIRDTVRRAAQIVEQRQLLLQHWRDRLNAESEQWRWARLQDSLAAE